MTHRRMTTTVNNSRRSLAAFLVAVLFLTTFSPAVSIGQEDQPSAAEPAKPYVDEIATVDIGGGYYSGLYLQQGKVPEDKNAHVYYTPVVYVVTDKGKVRMYINPGGELVLFIRFESNINFIEKAVRKKLVAMGKEENPNFNIEKGTKPYRIDVLPISVARLSASDRRGFVSERIRASFREKGEIPVHFYLSSSDKAKGFVEDLQRGTVSLVFEYAFAGVSDESCTARLEASQIQDIDLFKEVMGEGAKGKVARRQVVDLIDQIASRWKLVSRCADYAMASELAESMVDVLDTAETLAIADFDDLDKQVTMDPDSFKPDVETGIKKLKKTVTRDRLEDAWSRAYSEAKSEASQRGVAFGIGAVLKKIPIKLGFGASGSEAKDSSEASASAMRNFQDILRKEGISTEWNGKRFIPKSVEVYSTSKLRSAWARTFEKTITLTSGETGKQEVILTKESWTEIIPPEKERKIEERLTEYDQIISNLQAKQNTLANRSKQQFVDVWERVGGMQSQMHRRLTNSFKATTCYYKFDPRGRGDGNYYHNLRRQDDIAIIAGKSGCDDLDHATMNVVRMSKNSDDWGLFVWGVPKQCKFDVAVVFLDGTNVNQHNTYKTGLSGYRSINNTRKWCH